MSIAGREVYVIDVDERGTPKVKRLSDAAELLGDDMRRAADGIERLEQSMRKGERVIKSSRLSLLELDAGLNLASRAAGALRSTFNAFKEPVKLAIDTESGINALRTLGKDITATLRGELLALPAEVGQSTEQVLTAAYNALSAGINEGQLVDFLRQAGRAAKAGQADLVTAVDAGRIGLRAYADQGVSVEQVFDSMFAAVQVGVTTFPQLGAEVGNLLPSFSQMGGRLNEATAAIAELTAAGLTTSQAVTQINALVTGFARAANPTNRAGKILRGYGVDTSITALKAKGLTGVLEELNRATGGQAEVLGTLFERQEAGRALLTLLKNDMNGYKSALDATTNSAGKTASGFDIMNQGAAGTLRQFNALKEQALRELGEQLLPMVNEALRDLTVWFKAEGQQFTRELAENIGTVAKGFVAVGKAAGAALGALRDVGEFLGEAAGADYVATDRGLSVITDAYGKYTRDLYENVGATRELAVATAELNLLMAVAANTPSVLFGELSKAIDQTVESARTSAEVYASLGTAGDAFIAPLADAFNVVTGAVNSGDGALQGFIVALANVGSEAAATALPIFEVAAAVDQLFAATLKSNPKIKPRKPKKGKAPSPFDGQGEAAAKALIDALKAAEGIQDRASRNRLGAIEDQTTRELALLDLRFAEELRSAERAGDDIGAVKARQAREFGDRVAEIGQRQTQERLSIEQERARLAAQFEQDEFAQRRLNLEIEAEETLRRVSEVGGSVIDATAAFERRRTEIVREQSEARIRALQAEVNNAGELAGSLISLGDAITGSDRRQSAARVALQGAVLAAQATSAGAESLIEFARGNVIKGAALAAAAAAAGIDAIRLGAQAAGLGGSGAPSAGSGAQSRGSGSVERAPVQAPERTDNRPIVINAGLVVGERGVDKFGRLLASSVGRHRDGRNGYIGEEAS